MDVPSTSLAQRGKGGVGRLAPVGVRTERPAGLERLTGQHAQLRDVRSSLPAAHTLLATA